MLEPSSRNYNESQRRRRSGKDSTNCPLPRYCGGPRAQPASRARKKESGSAGVSVRRRNHRSSRQSRNSVIEGLENQSDGRVRRFYRDAHLWGRSSEGEWGRRRRAARGSEVVRLAQLPSGRNSPWSFVRGVVGHRSRPSRPPGRASTGGEERPVRYGIPALLLPHHLWWSVPPTRSAPCSRAMGGSSSRQTKKPRNEITKVW